MAHSCSRFGVNIEEKDYQKVAFIYMENQVKGLIALLITMYNILDVCNLFRKIIIQMAPYITLRYYLYIMLSAKVDEQR